MALITMPAHNLDDQWLAFLKEIGIEITDRSREPYDVEFSGTFEAIQKMLSEGYFYHEETSLAERLYYYHSIVGLTDSEKFELAKLVRPAIAEHYSNEFHVPDGNEYRVDVDDQHFAFWDEHQDAIAVKHYDMEQLGSEDDHKWVFKVYDGNVKVFV